MRRYYYTFFSRHAFTVTTTKSKTTDIMYLIKLLKLTNMTQMTTFVIFGWLFLNLMGDCQKKRAEVGISDGLQRKFFFLLKG
jgi:hypothetical protein